MTRPPKRPDDGSPLPQRMRRPGLDPLWDELARRMSTSARPVKAVQLRDLSSHEQAAIADLLGIDHLPGESPRIQTRSIIRALAIHPDQLRALVEELRGPLGNRAAERRASKQQSDELWAWLAEQVARWPLSTWVERLRSRGVPNGDVDAHRERLQEVLAVLAALPAGGLALSVLARSCTGDPHGLDWGTAAAGRVLDAVATIEEEPAPRSAREARRLWDRVGVVHDRHSVGVLVLGLRPQGGSPVAEYLRECAGQAEPVLLSLSQLQRWPVEAHASSVYLFENPSVLSMAAERRWSGPPLVCTSGWPNTAVLVLCQQLRKRGSQLYHHGDFDPAGVEITRYLRTHAEASPWRMSAAHYSELLHRCAAQPFSDCVPDTPWDPSLARAMRRQRKAVYEEDDIDDLLAALSG